MSDDPKESISATRRTFAALIGVVALWYGMFREQKQAANPSSLDSNTLPTLSAFNITYKVFQPEENVSALPAPLEVDQTHADITFNLTYLDGQDAVYLMSPPYCTEVMGAAAPCIEAVEIEGEPVHLDEVGAPQKTSSEGDALNLSDYLHEGINEVHFAVRTNGSPHLM